MVGGDCVGEYLSGCVDVVCEGVCWSGGVGWGVDF